MPGPDEAVPQRVWVLMGGDSPERQVSLASGLAVWLRLRTRPDLIVRPARSFHHELYCAGCWGGNPRGMNSPFSHYARDGPCRVDPHACPEGGC